MTTTSRMLELLGLLQSRAEWTGTELAERFAVTDRTIRNDIGRLRGLGYAVDATRGPAGSYRLGVGAKLPPLLVDDDEAVALAVGLRTVTATMQGIEEIGARALAKLDHVLPHRLRRKVDALRDAVVAGPENTDANVEDPAVDPALLAEIAAAVRDRTEVRFEYQATRREVEPYRLISWQRRWFLVGRDPASGEWTPFRVDWMNELRTHGGRHFVSSPSVPGGDFTAFVLREVAHTGWSVHARIGVDAPAEEVLARINPTVGVVESIDAGHSVLVTGADSVEIAAAYIGMLGLDFHVTEPAELVEAVRTLAARYARSLPDAVDDRCAEPPARRAESRAST